MLTGFILILYILFTSYISGLVFLELFGRISGIKHHQTDYAFVSISGICWLAFVLSGFHIFLKIGIESHVLVWIINVLVSIAFRKNISESFSKDIHDFMNKHLQVHFMYLLFLTGILLNIVSRSATGDVADYHLQAVRWIEEYKVVPGIGNIRRQLGNNSNWFLLNAFSGFSFLGLRSVYVMNASILIIACTYFIQGIERLLKGEHQRMLVIKTIILIYLSFTVFRSYVGAVTNDFPITLFTLFVFTKLLDTNRDDIFQRVLLLFFITMMITFKLSSLPFLILALGILMLLLPLMKIRHIVITLLLCVLPLIPWIYTNIQHSGYLVFPVSTIDIFDVDWKMPRRILDFEVYANLAWARAPFYDIKISKNFDFAQWFPIWIRSLDGFSLFLMVTSIISTFCIGFLLMMKASRIKILGVIKKENVMIIVTGVAAIGLWFTFGPTPRFILGYLVFLISAQIWVMSHVFPSIQHQLINRGRHVFLVIAAIFFVSCVPFLMKNFSLDRFGGILISPPHYSQVNLGKKYLENGYVNVPAGASQCWDSPLPCTGEPDSLLLWRGSSPGDGFKIK